MPFTDGESGHVFRLLRLSQSAQRVRQHFVPNPEAEVVATNVVEADSPGVAAGEHRGAGGGADLKNVVTVQ